MATLAESIRFIKDYSAGEEGEYQGDTWHNEWIRRSKWAGQSVPVVLAVAGPRTCRIAGELADVALSAGMDPVLQQWRMEQIEQGAKKAGRKLTDIDVWIRTQLYIADSKAAAKREMEPYAATCTWELYQILRQENPAVADLRQRMEKHHPGLLEEFKLICEHWNPYWTERIGGPQTEYTTQRVIDFFLASGTAEDINLQIAALESLGVKAISSVMFSIQEDLGMLERLYQRNPSGVSMRLPGSWSIGARHGHRQRIVRVRLMSLA